MGHDLDYLSGKSLEEQGVDLEKGVDLYLSGKSLEEKGPGVDLDRMSVSNSLRARILAF